MKRIVNALGAADAGIDPCAKRLSPCKALF